MITRTINIKVKLIQYDDNTGQASVAIGPWPALAELTTVGLTAVTTAIARALVESAVEARGVAAILGLTTDPAGPADFSNPTFANLLRNAGRG